MRAVERPEASILLTLTPEEAESVRVACEARAEDQAVYLEGMGDVEERLRRIEEIGRLLSVERMIASLDDQQEEDGEGGGPCS